MKTHKLFNEINQTLFKGTLTNKQKEGINYKLKAFNTHDIIDDRWRAYMLATSFHETARTMQPIEERGKGAGKPYGQKRKYSGAVYIEPNKLFFGRGDVQLTWFENYEKMEKLLNIPLLNEPELALNPFVSARIMIEGMTRGRSNRGDFTGVSLENYFNANKEDPFNARRIINGLDCAKLIEGYYRKFLSALRMSALRNSGLILVFVFVASSLLMLGGCKPKQLMNEQHVRKQGSIALFEYRDSLQIKEWQMSVLRTHLNRFIEENFNLESKTWQKEIYYDTGAEIDSACGKHPILSEIVSTNIITLDKSSINHEALVEVDSLEKINASSLNSNISLKVDKVIEENKSVETKLLHKIRFKYILIVLGAILFIIFFSR